MGRPLYYNGSMTQRVLFIDRDGTLIAEPVDEQIDSVQKLEIFQHALNGLARIAKLPYELVMVTNQDGLGTESFPEKNFWPPHDAMLEALTQAGAKFKEVLIDRSFAHEKKPTRKPGTGLLTHYMSGRYDLKNSFVIGDRLTDLELAKNLGCKGILLTTKPGQNDPKKIAEKNLGGVMALAAADWLEVADYLEKLNPKRQ